jgi:hypothetical protein
MTFEMALAATVAVLERHSFMSHCPYRRYCGHYASLGEKLTETAGLSVPRVYQIRDGRR